MSSKNKFSVVLDFHKKVKTAVLKTTILQMEKFELTKNADQELQSEIAWWRFGATASFVGFVLTMITGLILTTIPQFLGIEDSTLNINQVGNRLVTATIPAMMFGMLCFNKFEILNKAKRTEYHQ